MTAKHRSILGVIVLGLLSMAVVVLAVMTCLEFLLRVRAYWLEHRATAVSQPLFEARERAYDPFVVEDLNPQYFFFFPLDAGKRIAISNDVCSVDADGFRGPGPARAMGRRLAFLVGGSAAFGFLSSSDDTTITAYLNRLQDEYFFVNAGVPGWNTTQELFRVADQLLDYRPALVVTYDGYNDAMLLSHFQPAAGRYPIGTPANFDGLERIVRTHVLENRSPLVVSVLARLFPEVTERIDRRRASRAWRFWTGVERVSDVSTLPEPVVQAGAATYLANQGRMRDLARARGARFAAVFQPVAQLHRHIEPLPPDELPGIRQFHRAVMTGYAHDFELYDEGDAFDGEFASVPLVTKDLTPSTIFVDDVHLNDPGGEIMARHLARRLGLHCRRDACS